MISEDLLIVSNKTVNLDLTNSKNERLETDRYIIALHRGVKSENLISSKSQESEFDPNLSRIDPKAVVTREDEMPPSAVSVLQKLWINSIGHDK